MARTRNIADYLRAQMAADPELAAAVEAELARLRQSRFRYSLEIPAMSNASKVADALNDFAAATAAGDKDAAKTALIDALSSADAVYKSKSAAAPKAATAAATAADAAVVTACDACTAAMAAPPVVAAGAVGSVWTDLLDMFISNAPAIISWIRKLFGG